MNANELKETLTKMKSNHFQQLESVNISLLTSAMLQHIGNLDPVLRDGLIYNSFCHFICNDYYNEEELQHILHTCLDEQHLFYGIGDLQQDSVFTRSFSSLVVAAILHVNVQKGFLSSEDIEITTDKLLNYLEQEQDTRGLVSEKGWAHSIAHIADAFGELAKQPEIPESRHEDVFQAIIRKISFGNEVFQYEEDERMVIPVIEMMKKGLSEVVVCDKIKQIANDLNSKFLEDETQLFMYRANMKQFLRSLYFHLEWTEQYEGIRDCIKHALSVINEPYYT